MCRQDCKNLLKIGAELKQFVYADMKKQNVRAIIEQNKQLIMENGRLTEECIDKVRVKVDWLPKVDALWSKKVGVEEGAVMPKGKLRPSHLALLNWNKIFFAIEQMKNERNWWNMELSTELLQRLMKEPDWYELFIQEDDLMPRDFGRDVARWEEITIALLRAYIDRAYKMSKGKWESKYMETVYLSPNDPNFFEEYTVEVRNDKQEWIEKLHELREQILSGNLERDFTIYGT